MAGNRTVTSKGLALGAALREARVSAGHLNLSRFAERLGRSPATLSRWETGQRVPRPEDVAQILGVLGITGEPFEDILALTHDTGSSSWLAVSLPEQRRHLEALLRFERDARRITMVTPLLVPGWLQTPDYARAIMTAGGAPQDEIESRVRTRVGRREVLRQTELTAFVGHAALVQQIGGRDVMRKQLEFLLNRGKNVDLRVIPFATDWHPALEGPWSVIEPAQGTTVVYLENRRSGLFLHEEADIAAYREAAESVRDVALSTDESMRLITDEIHNLER
ncbi:helix-turn-helix domain-containing protein [Kibdelosporangium phytohabitans]|uniref:HTH cro/C1-type domain-containing protein n=1 Tax=Kibdelosporangium phytohabitans TaxID=860235 RepID=A0A0N9IFW6_9PSEU|nr:helix-turn-helix transcriptional regulator [Kibdelosporangium phytohabitans]ALG14198.1 hypothetical protein AOZ06_51565 [Kibdelosporangium phytohabitans]MBE1466808.1 transcriptional regulator with XRE-family HTH domain [Kibdelosporangium phytohabitans]